MIALSGKDLEYAKNIVDGIEADLNYEYMDCEFWDNHVEEYLPLECGMASGVTKGVIIPCDKPFVIKIPLKCDSDNWMSTCTHHSKWNSELHTWEDVPASEYSYCDHSFCPQFEYAYNPIDGTYGWNYCDAELGYYTLAKEKGIEEFFAATFYAGERKVDGVPIYLQEKITTLYSRSDKEHTQEDLNSTSAFLDETKVYCPLELDFVCDLIQNYGAEKTKEFCDFLDEYNISDLHRNNYGYRPDGTPCLIDFSDFNG